MSSAALSVLVLTEDSGADGYPTVEALTRAILALLDPLHRAEAVRMGPVEEERVRRVSQASYWKSEAEEHREALRELCNRIATQLVQPSPVGFVVYHIDGDRTWSTRHDADHPALFKKRIEKKVREILARKGRRTAAEIEQAMQRLFLLMPYYSIESWLYQNTDEALAIVHEKHGGSHAHVFAAWRADRTLLDEVHMPKRTEISPLGPHYNRRLAERGYPAAEVHAAERSFTLAVRKMADSATLVACLANAR